MKRKRDYKLLVWLFFREDGSLTWFGKFALAITALTVYVVCSLFGGCLSVVRVPVPVVERYSDDGVCTNRVWCAPASKIMASTNFPWRAYPTLYLRCAVTGAVFSPIDRTKRGEDLWRERRKYFAALPLAVILATAPLDAVFDTVFLPFDLYRTSRREILPAMTPGKTRSKP